MSYQTVIVLDFGGQYKELIARRVRECGVYSVILPGDTPLEKYQILSDNEYYENVEKSVIFY